MTLLKVFIATTILLFIAFSGLFIKLFIAKDGLKKNSSNDYSLSGQNAGCGCGSDTCCKTA
jgi:hypothetical protein